MGEESWSTWLVSWSKSCNLLEVDRRGVPGFSPQLHDSLCDFGKINKPLWVLVSKSVDAGTLLIFPESVRGRFSSHSHHASCLTDSDLKMPFQRG